MTRRREALINTVGTPMGSVDRLSVNGNGGSNGVDGEIHIGAEEGGVPPTAIVTPDGGLSPINLNAHVNHAFQTSPNKVLIPKIFENFSEQCNANCSWKIGKGRLGERKNEMRGGGKTNKDPFDQIYTYCIWHCRIPILFLTCRALELDNWG